MRAILTIGYLLIDRCSLGYPVAPSSSPAQPLGYVSAGHCVEYRVGAGVKIYQPDGSSDSYYIGYSYAASTAPDAFVIDVADKSQVSR